MMAFRSLVAAATLLLWAPPCRVAARDTAVDWYPYSKSKWAWLNATCGDGSQQSPINFASCRAPEERPAVDITWATQPVKLINNGNTVMLTAHGTPPGGMTVGGSSYTLWQCHFHWGSEHRVAKQQYPFEAHCVHTKDGDPGSYGVLGLFFEIGAPSAFLANFVDQLPARPPKRRLSAASVASDLFGNPVDDAAERRLAAPMTVSEYTGPLDFKQLYGENPLTHYWSYHGSLTTPPCTETLDWFVMMEPATLSQAQLDAFKRAIGWKAAGGDYRPPQPLNHRVVQGCAAEAAPSDAPQKERAMAPAEEAPAALALGEAAMAAAAAVEEEEGQAEAKAQEAQAEVDGAESAEEESRPEVARKDGAEEGQAEVAEEESQAEGAGEEGRAEDAEEEGQAEDAEEEGQADAALDARQAVMLRGALASGAYQCVPNGRLCIISMQCCSRSCNRVRRCVRVPR